MGDLVQLLDALQAEAKAKHAELKALDQTIHARRILLAELDERIGDHQKNLQTKQRLETLQAAARKFAEGLEAKGY